MISISIHFLKCHDFAFLRSCIVYVCHIFFIHLSVNKHLGWLNFLGLTNSTVLSMDMKIALWYADLESVEYTAESYASLGFSV